MYGFVSIVSMDSQELEARKGRKVHLAFLARLVTRFGRVVTSQKLQLQQLQNLQQLYVEKAWRKQSPTDLASVSLCVTRPESVTENPWTFEQSHPGTARWSLVDNPTYWDHGTLASRD